MLNGRNHPVARNGVAVSQRNGEAMADGESSAFYGVYEQQLADELAQLLKSGPAIRAATAEAGAKPSERPRMPGAPTDLMPPLAARPALSPPPAPEHTRSFVAAKRPDNDFSRALDTDEDPLPLAWRHESRPPRPSWLARQTRAAMLGLGAGLVVVLPAVAVLSGKLDHWLKSPPPAASARAERVASKIEPAGMPAATVAATRATSVPPARPPAAEPPVAPAARAVETRQIPVQTVQVTVPSLRPPEPPVAPPAPALPPPTASPPPVAAPLARSIVSVEAFPPAAMPGIVVAKPLQPPVRTPADEAAGLLLLGQTLVKEGDIAGAREPLARAANLGSAEAMLSLAETFDPNMLAAWGARNVKSDASTARMFYTQAAAAGLARAKTRLDALN